jgi:hypothetical protein
MPDKENDQDFKPFWLRIASFYFIVWGTYHFALTFLLVAGVIKVESELFTSDYLFTGALRVISVLYVAAGISLLRRRKISVFIFAIAVLANVAVYISFVVATGDSPLGSLEAPYKITEWIALVATTIYAWKLEKDGILS